MLISAFVRVPTQAEVERDESVVFELGLDVVGIEWVKSNSSSSPRTSEQRSTRSSRTFLMSSGDSAPCT